MPAETSFDYAQGTTPVPQVPRRLFHKATWGDDWTELPHMDVLGVVDGANRITEITVRHTAGTIIREGATDFAYEPLQPFVEEGHFGMVEFYDLDDAGDPDYDAPLERWIGVFNVDGRDVLGKNDDGFAADQTFLIHGLECLLAQTPVLGSVVVSNDPGTGTSTTKMAVRVDQPHTFNAPRVGGLKWDRNRGTTAVTTEYFGPGYESPTWTLPTPSAGAGIGEASIYAFDLKGDSTGQWKLSQILAHLFTFHAPWLADAAPFALDTLPHMIDSSDTSLQAALQAHVVYGFNADGMSLFDCLNALCSPARGLGWKLFYSDACKAGTAGPTVAIFSVNAEDVAVGDETFPASTVDDGLDVTGRRDVRWQAHVDREGRYGRIVVRGEPVLSCFSLSDADGTLVKDWTTQEESAYASPPGITVGTTTDAKKKIDHFRARSTNAWQCYRPKDNWDFTAKNGEAGIAPVCVNPRFADDGSLIETPGSRHTFGRRFESVLPIEVPLPAGATKPDQPQYRGMFVAAHAQSSDTYTTPEPFWFDLGNNYDAEMPPCSCVEPMHERFAVRVRCDPADLLSPSPVSDGACSVTDWRHMIVTTAIRTETRVSVAADVEGGDPARVLYVDVPDAELWLVVPGTVTGVNEDRTLKRHTGDRVVRDDRPRLKRALALAQAWYGQRRRPISMQFKSVVTRVASGEHADQMVKLRVGQLVRYVRDTSDSADVNTVITERRFDLARDATAIVTGYAYQPRFDGVL